MNNIVIFNNPQFGQIRTAGSSDNPLFCLSDVCAAVGIVNHRNVKARLDQEDVRLVDTPTEGGNQMLNYVTESGLYDTILRSESPNAKPFRRWVTSEVLPSIRKHGAYATEATIDSIIADPDNGIRLLKALKEERQQRRLAESKAEMLEEVTREQAPKVVFADAVIGSSSSILIGELAKVLRQNGINMGEKRLFKWMRDNGYLGTCGERRNIPNQRYIEQGLFTLKTNTYSVNGQMFCKSTTKVTGKGQQYFINKFMMQ